MEFFFFLRRREKEKGIAKSGALKKIANQKLLNKGHVV